MQYHSTIDVEEKSINVWCLHSWSTTLVLSATLNSPLQKIFWINLQLWTQLLQKNRVFGAAFRTLTKRVIVVWLPASQDFEKTPVSKKELKTTLTETHVSLFLNKQQYKYQSFFINSNSNNLSLIITIQKLNTIQSTLQMIILFVHRKIVFVQIIWLSYNLWHLGR